MKKIITSRLVLLSILIFANAAMAFAQERKGEKGISVTLTSKGFGIGLSYNRNNGPASMFTSDFEIINVNGQNEFTYTDPFDPYRRSIKIGDENLLLMPLMFGYRKNMWHDQIANNFQPYIQLSSGPVLAFDMKEEELNEEDPFAINTQEKVGFIEQFSKGKAYYTIGVSISGGAVIETSKHRFINISVNYSLIDFGRNLDERRAFGGLAFKVEFGSWIR